MKDTVYGGVDEVPIAVPFSKNCTCPVEIVREFVTHPNFDLRRDEWRVMVGLKPRPGAEPIAASAASAARTGGV